MSIAATADAAFASPGSPVADDPAPAMRPSIQQIVRSALHADALTSPSAERAALERELDRLQPLIAAEQAALGQQLNWTMLSQALLLNVFVVALVFGTAPALPGKRWLLAGIALFATVVAVLAYFAFRGSRQSLRGLLRRRAELEKMLQALGRHPVYAANDPITRGLGALAGRLLPAAFVVGWVGVSIYALATPNARAADDNVSVTTPAAGAPGARSRNGGVRTPAASDRAAPASEPAASEPQPARRSGFKW